MPPDPAGNEALKKTLRQACAELDRLLRAGQPSAAEEWFGRFPELEADADCALELIYTEFVLREELGQKPSPAAWYARFPRWRERLERLLQVHAQLGAPASEEKALAPDLSPPR